MFKKLLLTGVFLLAAAPLFAATLHFSWTPNTESDLAGYKLHTGIASGTYTKTVDVGNVTDYVMANVEEGQTIYGALTAYDTSDNESGYSEEAHIFVPVIPTISVPEKPTVIIIYP